MASRINQSLAFHASPESFISSRLQELSRQEPDLFSREAQRRTILRASILDRHVHIVSSYRLCHSILNDTLGEDGFEGCSVVVRPASASVTVGNGEGDDDEVEYFFAAQPAYEKFMAAFFPGPNILLQDGHEHTLHKSGWKQLLADLPALSVDLTKELVQTRFVKPVATTGQNTSTLDLYDAMKSLAWDVLLGVFLALDRGDEKSLFTRFEGLQEDVLRGQFSLFPVRIWTPFWSSARSKGLQAVKDIRRFLTQHLTTTFDKQQQRSSSSHNGKSCPYMECLQSWDQVLAEGASLKEGAEREEDVVAHTLLFTSSIANKALASLLTAFLLNLFLWRSGGGPGGRESESGVVSLAQLVRSQADTATRTRMLQSILSETERLSPPVVGVMRRVRKDIAIQNQQFCRMEEAPPDHDYEYKIPEGHDAWLYLAGASRDPGAFADPDKFVWDRYMQGHEEEGLVGNSFAFGGGPKTCLGAALSRQICLTVAESIIMDSKLQIEGEVADRGVRYWLGWEQDVPLDVVAKDLKQLPCQRPRRPVMVNTSVRKD